MRPPAGRPPVHCSASSRASWCGDAYGAYGCRRPTSMATRSSSRSSSAGSGTTSSRGRSPGGCGAAGPAVTHTIRQSGLTRGGPRSPRGSSASASGSTRKADRPRRARAADPRGAGPRRRSQGFSGTFGDDGLGAAGSSSAPQAGRGLLTRRVHGRASCRPLARGAPTLAGVPSEPPAAASPPGLPRLVGGGQVWIPSRSGAKSNPSMPPNLHPFAGLLLDLYSPEAIVRMAVLWLGPAFQPLGPWLAGSYAEQVAEESERRGMLRDSVFWDSLFLERPYREKDVRTVEAKFRGRRDIQVLRPTAMDVRTKRLSPSFARKKPNFDKTRRRDSLFTPREAVVMNKAALALSDLVKGVTAVVLPSRDMARPPFLDLTEAMKAGPAYVPPLAIPEIRFPALEAAALLPARRVSATVPSSG